MLKQVFNAFVRLFQTQPPSGGCVLKLNLLTFDADKRTQPPSGGCVLKRCLTVWI